MLRDMPARKSRKTVTVVGAGNLARALATLLPSAGYRIDEIVTRSGSKRRQSAAAFARRVGAKHVTSQHAQWSADIIWLAVNDSAIPHCATEFAQLANWKGRVVLHSSGALSSDELAPLRRAGASVASAHPMMTFVPGRAPAIAGVTWTLEGQREAISTARRIVAAMEGQTLIIRKEDKALYHAFGAFLSPLLVAHLVAAAQVAEAAGIARKALPQLMRPIVFQTLQNLFQNIGVKGGAGKAFSGPLIRGDVATIERHLRSLRKLPEARRLYVAVASAATMGELPVKNRAEIVRLLRRYS